MSKDAFVFNPNDWFTPNTYNTNFRELPKSKGVYLLVSTTFGEKECFYEVLYVGSSKNLINRYKNHEVKRELQEIYDYIQFYFKEVENHFEVEKSLIKQIQPEYNTKWR